MKHHIFGAALLMSTMLLPAAAQGQGNGEQPWGPGTTLTMFAGAASSDSRVSGVAGASLGWELTPYFAVEGSGSWIAESVGTQGFVALLGPRVALLSPRTVVPSVFAGVGMFRASVDRNDARLPRFYGRRVGLTPGVGERIFEDFVVAVGGGADVYLGNHVAIRPDLRMLFVTADSETRVVPMVGVNLTYHFEPHPYLP